MTLLTSVVITFHITAQCIKLHFLMLARSLERKRNAMYLSLFRMQPNRSNPD